MSIYTNERMPTTHTHKKHKHSALTSSEPAAPRMATGPSLAGCSITELFADAPVHGMHLLCVQRTPTGLFATAFMDGRNATGAGPITVSAPAEDMGALRAQLQEALGLLPQGRREPRMGPRNNAPNTFQPWALFTPQGFAVESLLDLKEGANDVLLYEGGKFIWCVEMTRVSVSNTHMHARIRSDLGSNSTPPTPLQSPHPKNERPHRRPGVREGHVTQVTQVDGVEGGGVSMRTLSMSPLVFSVEGFLTPAECRHIRDRAGPHMRQSGVALMDHDKGKAATDWRTSATYFMRSFGDAVLQGVDRRVADLTRQPEESQEDVQVLRYDHTQRCVRRGWWGLGGKGKRGLGKWGSWAEKCNTPTCVGVLLIGGWVGVGSCSTPTCVFDNTRASGTTRTTTSSTIASTRTTRAPCT